MEQSTVHRKGQARLAATARGLGGARAQRVIEVGRVHLRALVRRARMQPRQRVARTTPRLHQRAVAGAILQAAHIEAIVEHFDVGSTCTRACEH